MSRVEVIAVALVIGLVIALALTLLIAAAHARLTCWRIGRLLKGPTSHADPARMHREIWLEVERLSRERRGLAPRTPDVVAGAARGVDAGILAPAAAVSLHATAGSSPRAGDVDGRDRDLSRETPRVVRGTEYGRSTRLVAFPRGAKGLNGTRRITPWAPEE